MLLFKLAVIKAPLPTTPLITPSIIVSTVPLAFAYCYSVIEVCCDVWLGWIKFAADGREHQVTIAPHTT